MVSPKKILYLPVETAARELDAKLLLGLCATTRGFSVVIGNRALLNRRLHKLEPGIYLSHNFDRRRRRIVSIAERLGHRIIAWDEEGLVWLDAEKYLSRRAHPATIKKLQAIFAWGPEHAAALRPVVDHTSVQLLDVGNPRADLLGSKLRVLYEQQAARLKQDHGRFILINSTFGWLNYALGQGDPLNRGDTELAAIAERSRHPVGYIRFQYAAYRSLADVIPRLAERYPDSKIIIRPHPSEDHAAWTRIADGIRNVAVKFDADLVPWLLAADTMIHSGCTTAVESAMLGRTAIAYITQDGGPFVSPQPLAVSINASTQAALFEAIDARTADRTMPDHVRASLDKIATRSQSEFAAERIATEIERIAAQPHAIRPVNRGVGYAQCLVRTIDQTVRSWRPTSPSNQAYIDQKFPPTATDIIADRAKTLAGLLDIAPPNIRQTSDRIYLLQPSV